MHHLAQNPPRHPAEGATCDTLPRAAADDHGYLGAGGRQQLDEVLEGISPVSIDDEYPLMRRVVETSAESCTVTAIDVVREDSDSGYSGKDFRARIRRTVIYADYLEPEPGNVGASGLDAHQGLFDRTFLVEHGHDDHAGLLVHDHSAFAEALE